MFELQPDIAWDKGKAVLWLLDKLVLPMALAPTGAVSNGIAGTNGSGNRTGGGTAAAGTGGAGDDEGSEEEEDDDDEYSDRFFTVFIGDDKTDEVRAASSLGAFQVWRVLEVWRQLSDQRISRSQSACP